VGAAVRRGTVWGSVVVKFLLLLPVVGFCHVFASTCVADMVWQD
jgi:hypothetical protein